MASPPDPSCTPLFSPFPTTTRSPGSSRNLLISSSVFSSATTLAISALFRWPSLGSRALRLPTILLPPPHLPHGRRNRSRPLGQLSWPPGHLPIIQQFHASPNYSRAGKGSQITRTRPHLHRSGPHAKNSECLIGKLSFSQTHVFGRCARDRLHPLYRKLRPDFNAINSSPGKFAFSIGGDKCPGPLSARPSLPRRPARLYPLHIRGSLLPDHIGCPLPRVAPSPRDHGGLLISRSNLSGGPFLQH